MAEVKPKIVAYLLQSAVRGRSNRTARAAVPGRMPFVQKLAGGRIVVRRARPARISEAVLKANIIEIRAAVAKHHLVVTTIDGRPVDLVSFEAGPLVASASPPPNPPLDSAKNDKNEGVGYNVPGAPEGTTADAEEPELLRQGPPLDLSDAESSLEDDGEDESEDAGPEAETTLGTSPSTSPRSSHKKNKGKGKRS